MTSTLLDNFPLILDKTFESLPVLVKRDDWPLYNHKLRLALSTWVSPYSRWGGSRGVPTASPSDPSSITKGTAPADAPASSPPFLPMAYDFILTCRDSVVAGAILLRLDPSIHETFVPIAMDGLGNYTHRLYLALSLSFGHHGPHHVYASITELFEMECGEGDDVVAWMRPLGTMRRHHEEIRWTGRISMSTHFSMVSLPVSPIGGISSLARPLAKRLLIANLLSSTSILRLLTLRRLLLQLLPPPSTALTKILLPSTLKSRGKGLNPLINNNKCE